MTDTDATFPAADDLVEVRLVCTQEALGALISALDLHGRIAMGQWNEVVHHAPKVLPADQAFHFSDAAKALMNVRCDYAEHETLRSSHGASMGIAEAGRDARLVCDLWRALGGGMKERSDMRLTDGVKTATVRPVSAEGGTIEEDTQPEMTIDEIRVAMQKALDWAGVTLEDLEAQAAVRDFQSDQAEVAWFRISDFVKQGIRP